jgi:ribosomal protein S14
MLMKISKEDKMRGRGTRQCRVCKTARGLIRIDNLRICRRCFREVGEYLGFRTYGK